MSSATNFGKVATLDWTKVLTKCTPPVRKGVMELRANHEDLRRLISEAQASMPKLNFDYYRSKLSTTEYSKILNDTEESIKMFQPTKVDVVQKLKELESQREAKMREAGEFLQKLESDIAKLKIQLEKLRSAKPVDEMTVDDVYALNPGVKEQIFNSIKNDNWATEDEKEEGSGGATAGSQAKTHH